MVREDGDAGCEDGGASTEVGKDDFDVWVETLFESGY